MAAVCEAEFIDSVRRTCKGFQLGAEYVNPSIEVDVSYRSSPDDLLFHDHAWGTETAARSIERGADVVFAIGDDTAEAALETAADRGALIIGAETDLYKDLPELQAALVTSAVLDIHGSLLAVLQDTSEGHFRSGQHWGKVSLAPFHEFAGRLPATIFAQLDKITEELQAGAIRLDAAK